MSALKEKIICCFDQGAKTYEQAADVQIIAAHHLCHQLQSVNAQKIIEIGCGTGLFSELMVKQFPRADFMITDISPMMVKAASERFKHSSNVTAICLDGEHLPLPLDYDLIVSNMALHWFTQFDVSMKKIIDALPPTKQFSFALLGANSLLEWRALCTEHHLSIGKVDFPSVSDLQAICPTVHIHVERVTQTYRSVYAFLKTLKQLGADATQEGYKIIPATVLRRLIRSAEQPFQLSYEVIYGTYIKS